MVSACRGLYRGDILSSYPDAADLFHPVPSRAACSWGVNLCRQSSRACQPRPPQPYQTLPSWVCQLSLSHVSWSDTCHESQPILRSFRRANIRMVHGGTYVS